MKCTTPIDPETKMALSGESLEAALNDPDSPRCGYELEPDDVFCPSCGAKVEQPASPDIQSQPKSRSRIWRIVLVMPILAMLMSIGYYIRQENKKTAAANRYIAEREISNLLMAYNGDTGKNTGVEASRWHCKAVEQVDAFHTGLNYYKKKDFVKAVAWFRRSAEHGNADAQYNLGLMYHKGEGVSKNFSEAVKWWRKAAENGLVPAQLNVGVCYAMGDGVGRDMKEAVKWFRKVESNSLWRGDNLQSPKSRPPKVAEQAKDNAAAIAMAQYFLGQCCKNGDGMEMNEMEAVRFFRKAAEAGYAEAQFELGLCYLNGNGVKKDNEEGHKWLRKAVDQGHEGAETVLTMESIMGKAAVGSLSENENVSPAKLHELDFVRKAAEQGDANAQFRLGEMYVNGFDGEEDESEAVKWYRMAADQGLAQAQFRLGQCYDLGEGVEENEAEAVKWYRKAAAQGHAEAQDWLEMISENLKDAENTDSVKTAERGCSLAKDISIEGLSLTMKWCSPGTFMMGSLETEAGRFPEESRHSVTIPKGFWIGETEVTQGQWKLLMGETIVDLAARTAKYRQKKEDVKNLYDEPDDDVPVYNVCWDDAAEFCRKLNTREKAASRVPDGYEYRLPSEEEWEYACRAGTKTSLPNNKDIHIIGEYNAPELDEIAWYGGNSSVGFSGRGWDVTYIAGKQHSGQRAAPRVVKGKKPNAWGLYDMLGNVSEWCVDRMENGRAMRGGSWSNKARLCRPARRAWNAPNWRGNYIGFRVVLAPIVEKSSTATGEIESIDRKAAEQGDAAAQNRLGYRYTMGNGVAKDDKEAVKWYRKAAEQGYAPAQNSLGFSYLKGNGVEKNAAEAVKWFRKAAEQGYAKAQCQLGFCYARGKGVTRDTEEALKWLRKAAEQGDGAACCEMGEIYRRGLGRQKDANKATEWYRKGAAVGDSGCITSLGFRYFYGNSDSTPKDHKKALELFQKSIEIDRRPWAYDGAGLVYYYGETGKPDYKKAVEMFSKASSMGVYEADYYLGVCYKMGRGVAMDQVEAVKWFEKAANRGSVDAYYEVGEAHRKGVGKKKDMNKSVEWYRKGVELGHSGCTMSLGFRYLYGESDLTPKDPKKALELFQKSIDIDDRPWAYYGAGLAYFHGIDGKPDYEKAVEMLKKASDRGVVCANYNLGVCYENGNGVEKDINKATALYEKAAKGFDPAKKALERMNRNEQ